MKTNRQSLFLTGACLALAIMGDFTGPALGQALAQSAGARTTTNGAELAWGYQSDLMFLANPFMEGRGPGTRGNEIAAEFIKERFRALGLEPLFVNGSERSYLSAFTAGRSASTKQSVLDRADGDDDSAVIGHVGLGFAGSGDVAAPLVFVGYSIQGGGPEKSYNTFSKDDDLSGKIAVMLRFEPMDAQGKSLWRKPSDGPWTVAAGLSAKIQESLKRGAAGLIIVNTPGADDPRVRKVESTEGTARWMREIDAPAMLLSPDQFGALLTRVGEKRSAMELRALADGAGGISVLGDTPVRMNMQVERRARTTWNVAATLPGVGALASQYVVVGAHYDHVGYGFTGGSRTDEYGVVHPGADDNASGTSGLMLAARLLSQRLAGDRQPRRTLLFIAFSAEEMGLIGSREFVKSGVLAASSMSAMINMDMIGRLRDDGLELAGTGTAEGFDDVLNPIIESSGLKVKRTPGGRGPSDHATFYGAGIPVLHLFTGLHEQYHTPRDSAELINIEGAVRVATLASDIAGVLAVRTEPLVFKSADPSRQGKPGDKDDKGDKGDTPGPSMANVKVRFGIAPGNYAEEKSGVLVDDVFAGTSAAEAGILKGDRLMRWNGQEIADVANWMEYLSKHQPGDVVDVTIKRGAEEVVVRVTLKSRDQVAR